MIRIKKKLKIFTGHILTEVLNFFDFLIDSSQFSIAVLPVLQFSVNDIIILRSDR